MFLKISRKNSDKIPTNVENKHSKYNKDIVKYGQNVKHNNKYQ